MGEHTGPAGSADFIGKSILVTGGGSGIGLAIARSLAGAGAHVTICGRNKQKLDAAAESIRADGLRGVVTP